MSQPTSKPHPQHRALAALDALIQEAELEHTAQQAETDRIIADGRQPRRETITLGFATTRLAQLRRSRETLLSGDQHLVLSTAALDAV